MNMSTFETKDLKFNAKFEGNPFIDVDFFAEVKSSTGEIQKLHGFYNGEEEFILRVNFDVEGEYTYITHSNVEQLNEISGSISVAPNTDSSKHGTLALSKENPNRLFYKDGTHYNLCAFECDWLFAVSYDDKENLTKTKKLIEQMAENNFNQVVMNVYAYDLQWERYEWEQDPAILPEHDHSARNDIYPFGGSNVDPDFSTLNVDFFKHLDNIIALLDDKNIVSHLMIYVWNKKVNWPESGSVYDNMYFDYVVKRYQAYTNILWDISKEALGYGHCDMNYIVDRIIRLKNLDSFKRLVTVHDYGFCNRFPTLVDILSTQTWLYDIYSAMKEAATNHPDKVIFNIEHGGYEEGDYQIFTGNYTSAKTCLKRNYEIMFAGVYSSYYWQPISWSVTLMPWEAKNPPHMEYYKYMVDFFNEQGFENLVPNKAIGHGGFNMSNADESKLLIYCHNDNFRVTLTGMGRFNGKQCTYKFFDTITGEYSKEESLTLGIHNGFLLPFENDCVLVLDII